MTLISLVFLFVYLFGAYAYGAATVYGLWHIARSGASRARSYAPTSCASGSTGPASRCSSISTVWFVLHMLIEFRNFTGYTREGWLDLATLIVFLFPPVIMHTVYLESHCEGDPPPPRDLPIPARGDVCRSSPVDGRLHGRRRSSTVPRPEPSAC